MELDALYRVFLMPQAHNFTIIRAGSNLQAIRESIRQHCQRVVANGSEGIGQPGQYSLAVMIYQRRLAVHYLLSLPYLTTIAITNTLVSQADTEYR